MNKGLTYSPIKHLRSLFVFTAVFLIAMASCSAKNSIRGYANIPVHAELGVKQSATACVNGETQKLEVVSVSTWTPLQLLPVFFAVSLFLILSFGYRPLRINPLYRTKPIASPVPLFLQYQRLKLHL